MKYGDDTEELLKRVSKATTDLYVAGLMITSLPPLPATLEELHCSETELISLPELPPKLKVLYCSYTQLKSLPKLPPKLKELYCDNTELTSLPELPATLEELICNNTQITSLPKLPETLEYLDCSDTKITILPELPTGLQTLIVTNTPLKIPKADNESIVQYNERTKQLRDEIEAECYDCGASPAPIKGDDGNMYCESCWNGVPQTTANKHGPDTEELLKRVSKATTLLDVYKLNITSLPPLPPTLTYMNCTSTQITSLPKLPSGLQYLMCAYTKLKSLPELPATLIDLICNNTQITSLPELPPTLEHLVCNNTPLKSLPKLPPSLSILDVSNTPLTSLPELPARLIDLQCLNTPLTSLPKLPAKVHVSGCSNLQTNTGPTPAPVPLVAKLVENETNLTKFKKESNAFLKTLKPDDLQLLRVYTTPSGYVVLNTTLRGVIVPPPSSARFLSEMKALRRHYLLKLPKDCDTIGVTRCYTNLFLNVWKSVPPLQHELQVYRGIQRTEENLLHDNQFLSTSTNSSVAVGFSGKDCCFMYITLKPGIRALFIGDVSTYKQESEILVGPPFRATIVKEDVDTTGRVVKHIVIEPRKKTGGTRRRRTYRKRKAKGTRKQKL